MSAEGDDGALSIAACLSACVAAYGVYLGLPLILGALASLYGFTNTQIGWIGSAENAGMLAGSIAVSAFGRSSNFKTLVLIGIAIAGVGDAITIVTGTFAGFCTIRFLAGFGNGLCYSAAIALLSRTRRAPRNFSIFIVVLVIANSLELWIIPGVVSSWGVRGLYIALGCLYFAPLALINRLPAAASTVNTSADAKSATIAIPIALPWLCLCAVVLFNVSASALWAYAERIGASIGMSDRTVSNTLTICNLVSVTGSVFAYSLSRLWGQHRPQLAATAVMIFVFAAWSIHLSPHIFGIGILLFFEVWSMASVFQLSTLSNIDPTGRRVALIPGAQGLGQSLGPFIAGALLGLDFSFPQMLLSVASFAVGSFIVYGTVYAGLRRTNLAVANA